MRDACVSAWKESGSLITSQNIFIFLQTKKNKKKEVGANYPFLEQQWLLSTLQKQDPTEGGEFAEATNKTQDTDAKEKRVAERRNGNH